MKFNCGPTKAEKRMLKAAKKAAAFKAKQKWHKKFLWWPKRIGPRDCRWLETIEQRFVNITHQNRYGDYYEEEWVMKYRVLDGELSSSRSL